MKYSRCDVSEFGRRLRILRIERGLSMDAFCDKYNAASKQRLSKSTVSRWENNIQEPLVSTVAAVASFFGVSPLWLLGESEDRNCSAAGNIQNSAVVQGNHATTLIVRNGKDSETTLSEQETELLRVYQSLSVKGQTKLLSFAFSLETEKTKGE